MSPRSPNTLFRDASCSDSWEDGELLFSRGWRENADGSRQAVLVVQPATEHPTAASLDRLVHEYTLRDKLNPEWAVRPLALEREGEQTTLLLNDEGGQPLARSLGAPFEIGAFLRLAISITTALGKGHQNGLVHRDLKPAHILVMEGDTEVRLTGFGLASLLSREHQTAEPPDVIAGTLAYMAPEQTGRMNRATDSRSDLYALGVIFYELTTGTLPFTTSDPIQLIHCHIARAPAPPNALAPRAPEQISLIVMKLLAKAAEDRYQTAAGLEADLRTCLAALEATGRIELFPLAANDAPDRLLTPERLYGRQSEVATLLTAFDRVASSCETHLVLVSGYSGIGKSSVVNELHKVIVLPHGIFISGKFDQRSRDIPYATVAEAFQVLIRQILSGKAAEIARWRDSILEAIGTNGRLLMDLIPELIRMIGPQPDLPDLAPFEAQLRFQAVLQRFVGVFAQPEHPLLIFIDDLQWLDPATLAFVEQLATNPEIGHLLLIGAYRDNEVGSDHMLLRTVAAIRQAGTPVEEIALGPISLADVTELVADTLRCPPTRSVRLARLIYRKTGGNPFFAVQFLTNLAEEALIWRDPKTCAWTWDLEGIDAKGFTDNLVDLMVGRLRRLPPGAQDALKLMACLGSNAEIAALELVLGAPRAEINESLRVAVQAGIIVSRGGHYRFLHDRVQEAAYALIPNAERPALHFHAGQRLLAEMTDDEIAQRIFDIVNQLNLGGPACNDQDQKARVAGLNLQAGLRAKASTAYASACSYFASGLATLGDQAWEQAYELAFKLLLERAECELFNANSAVSAELIELLLANARTKTDRTEGFRLRITLQLLRGDMALAVRTALECLKMFDMTFPERPTAEDVREEYDELQRRIGFRSAENLIDLPLTEDPEIRALGSILLILGQSSYFVDHRLFGILACRMVKLSIDFGHSASGINGYGALGIILGPTFGRFEDGERLARVAVAVTERHGFPAHRPAAYVLLQMASLWTHTIDEALGCLDVADKTAAETGEVMWACISAEHRITNLLARGDRLDLIWPQLINSLTFVRKKGYAHIIDVLLAVQRYIATLRGDTSNDNLCDEATLLRTGIPIVQCFYWILQLQLHYLMGDPVAALEAAENAKPLLWSARYHIQTGTFQFYHALALLAVIRSAPTSEPSTLRESLKNSFAALQTLTENAPHINAHKRDLAVAEFAGLEGRDLEAMRLYEQSVRSASENGFIQEAALGAELAANFFASRGLEKIAQSYRREAREHYRRWGALGKVAQLDRRHPEAAPKVTQPYLPTVETSLEHLDLATVIRMSQAVAGELLLDRLIEILMTIAIEHAGADRGLLVLPYGDDLRVEAEAKSTAETVSVRLVGGDTPAPGLPATVLAHVRRTQLPVILDDARAKTPFLTDSYLRLNHVRSVLCLPLVKQGELSGILYLENRLASHVFTPARIAVLTVLSSQTAISLQNTRLYNDLAEREGRIRRLVDANIIGIAIGDLDGHIREANDAFLRIVGYDRDDLVTRRLRWRDLKPPEQLDNDARGGIPELRMEGTLQPYEAEFVRKDGRRVPVLVGGALFKEGGSECVAFMLDLSERKRAEEALRELEADLAHMNRLSVMGELAASLAHEVKQPIGSARNNARAALNFLNKRSPDLGEAREALDCAVGDADRAADIIDRLRDHIKKAPPRRDWFDLNNAIDEIIALARSAISKNEVTVQTRLREGLFPVQGDRVQLQQVVLNLILNAVEAMRSIEAGERELLITTERSQTDGALVAVKDSGPGIDPEQLDRVFEAFYTTKPSGVGMGLSICRSIIRAHGGRLWVEPNKPRGAIFQFALPNAEKDS